MWLSPGWLWFHCSPRPVPERGMEKAEEQRYGCPAELGPNSSVPTSCVSLGESLNLSEL